MTGFLEAVREVQSSGQFKFLDKSVATSDVLKLMGI